MIVVIIIIIVVRIILVVVILVILVIIVVIIIVILVQNRWSPFTNSPFTMCGEICVVCIHVHHCVGTIQRSCDDPAQV